MGRPPDPRRKRELLDDAVDYAVANGLEGFTLRPLAQALGVQPNTLVHHFGSKEQLLSEVLNGVRDRLRRMRAQLAAEPDGDPLWGVWEWTADPEREAFFRFFFEAYGLALRRPDSFRPFLGRVVSDWVPTGEAGESADRGAKASEGAAAERTLELAVLRGLLLDLLTTGERDRVESALRRYAALV
jgi:AcrR family transcriptional regulator